MAIFHCHIKIGKRSAGRSATAAAAYRSGDKIRDQEQKLMHDYSQKTGVVHSEIMLPENAPEQYKDRAALWNSVQAIEKSKDAQLFREVEIALPSEMTLEQQKDLVRDYVRENFVSKGMIADWSIHNKKNGNPHSHILLTMRGIKKDGSWDAKRHDVYANDIDERGNPIFNPDKPSGKEYRIPRLDKDGNQKRDKKGAAVWERVKVEVNDWNDPKNAELWRESWARKCNERLPEHLKIDHRSFERRGLDKIPTIHEGYVARALEKRGLISERCQLNREIRALNEAQRIIEEKQRELIVAKRRIERDKNIERYLKERGVTEYDRDYKDYIQNRRTTADRADKRGGKKDIVRRARKSDAGSVRRDQRRSFESFEQRRYLQDVQLFDLDPQTERASLLLSGAERNNLEVNEAERVRDPNLQFKGADEQRERIQRQIDAIRRRKRAEKLASEKSSIKNQSARIATTGSQIDAIKNKRKAEANYKRGVDSVMQAVKTGAAIPDKVISAMLPDDIKQVYSAAKKMLTMPLNPKNLLPHNMIKNAFEVIGQCAKAGDNGAQAFLQNHGAIGDNVKARWDLMSVMEQDELKSKFVYADDWGFEEKSPMEALNRRGPVNPIPSGREQNKERVRVLTFGH